MSIKPISILANGNILIAGEFDETTSLSGPINTKSRLYANGNYQINGELDEVTPVGPSGQAIFTGDGTYSGIGIAGAGTLTSGSVGSVSASGPGGYYTYSWVCPPSA